MIHFEETDSFKKDFKKLKKKYHSLLSDFLRFKEKIKTSPTGDSLKKFSTLKKNSKFTFIKARFSCLSLKKKSLRAVYAYSEKEKKVTFLELYFKGDKENHSEERISSHIAFYSLS